MKANWCVRVGSCVAAGLPLLLGVGCATTQPPSELVQARDAYAESKRSAAAEYDPAALHEAKVALERAEELFKEEEDERGTRDAAYIAMRLAQRAKVEGQTAKLQERKEQARQRAAELQAKAADQTQEQLVSTREQLQSAQQAREAAEARAREAMMQLQLTQAAKVTEEPRGTVITVPGAFLFESGQSTLLSQANQKLNEIVAALKEQPEDRRIVIEGHTDSRGSAEMNMDLSQARANAVAMYLAQNGIPRENIKATGVGESQPVASNDTAEGRANNRRVEIMVERVEPR